MSISYIYSHNPKEYDSNNDFDFIVKYLDNIETGYYKADDLTSDTKVYLLDDNNLSYNKRTINIPEIICTLRFCFAKDFAQKDI